MTGPLRDIKAAAEWLGISPRTLEEYVSARTVPFTKIGRLIRFSDEDLAEIVAAGKQRPRESGALLTLARPPAGPPSRQPSRPSAPPPAPRPPAGPATPAPPPGPKTNPAAEKRNVA